MGNIKVLFLCFDMDPMNFQGDQHTGAAHLYVKETLNMLNEKNIETLAFTRWDSLNKPEEEYIGKSVRLVRIPIGDIRIEPKEILWGKDEEIFRKCLGIVEDLKFKPSIIHAVYWYSGAVGERFIKKYNVPFLYTVISLGKIKHAALNKKMTDHDYYREEAEQRIFMKADGIISVSIQERENIINNYLNIDPQKIYVIGRGVDPILFSNKRNENDNFFSLKQGKFLFFAGRIIQSKGLSFLFQVYDRLLNSPLIDVPSLLIAGGTKIEIDRMKKQITNTSGLYNATLSRKIRWLGIIPHDQIPIYYRNALATCLPSLYDPAARVILESMACGTPVIMTKTGYANEVVFHGVNGYIAEYGDIGKWITYISAFVNDPAWRDKLGKRARETVIPYFSLRMFGDRHWEIYQKLLNKQFQFKTFPQKNQQEIRNILPEWDVLDRSDESNNDMVSEKQVAEWLKRIKFSYTDLHEIPQRGISSSQIFHVASDKKEFIIKRPRNKMLFYRVFYPTNHEKEMYFRSVEARWIAEIDNSGDPFFLPVIVSDERYRLILKKKIPFIPIKWDEMQINSLFSNIQQFHERQSEKHSTLIKNYRKLEDTDQITQSFLRSYDNHLNELNARKHGDLSWFTPARAYIELSRIAIWLNVEFFNGGRISNKHRNQCEFLCQVTKLKFGKINVIWHECRPEHIYKSISGKLYGIDSESFALGEEAIDYATFYWWYLDARRSDISPIDWDFLVSLINKNLVCDQKLVLIWLWIIDFYWIQWDWFRGRGDRIHRFELLLDKIFAEIKDR